METLLNEKELSKILKCSIQTLRNDRSAKKGFPYIKLGRSVRYQISDIIEYLNQHRVYPKEGSSDVHNPTPNS